MATRNGTNGNDSITGTYRSDVISGLSGNDTINALEGNDNINAGAGDDYVLAGRDNDTVIGDTGNDTIYGEDGADSLRGDAGDDVIYGGTGNDTLDGGADNDSLDGGADNDLIYGGDGNDTLAGGSGFNTVYGGAGNDVWLAGGADTASAGNDTVYLEDGDDLAYLGWFISSGSADLIDGGTGNDTISFEATGTTALGITLNDDGTSSSTTFSATVTGFENVIGNEGANAITGNSLDNMLSGGAGNDTLIGNAGNDSLYGGDGADSVDGGTGADLITGDAGADTLSGGDGNDTISGGADADQLYGDAGDDSLDGGTGNDTINAGSGDDTLHGGAGADALYGGTGMDYLDYTDSGAAVSINLSTGAASGGDAAGDTFAGVDGILGSAYNDTLVGFDAANLSGSEDDYTNIIYGNAGNDYIDGMGSDDSLYGGADNDTVLGGAGEDLVDGGTGDDSLSGGAGDDTLLGGDGNDYLEGGDGSNVYDGGAGSDTIVLTAGASETIIGSEDVGDTDTDVIVINQHQVDYIIAGADAESGTIVWKNGATTTFQNIENQTFVPCFTPGTLIETNRGSVPVEKLKLGARVLTRDNGYQVIRWIGRRRLSAADLVAEPHLQPVRIAAGALGGGLPETDMVVSPQHRMLITGARAELLFGEAEVLAAAVHMVGLPGITRLEVAEVVYLHLMFDAHEIIRADGSWTESFQPGDHTLSSLEAPQREELFAIFPDLRHTKRRGRWPSARTSLKAHEVRVLMAA